MTTAVKASKRLSVLLALLLCLTPCFSLADERLEPVLPVPENVQLLLSVAADEVGYKEGAHGYTKYGEWSGDPYTQWCAEYLCWSVAMTDIRYGTGMLTVTYPLYSGTNSGRDWFIREGRYIARNGHVDGWGYQWLNGADHFITPGEYIPQPGDWVFFTWDSDTDTDHVAMVEYCTRGKDGKVTVHVLEGNNPNAVARNTYAVTYNRILGYGTVHDLAGITLRQGCSGAKVLAFQKKLVNLGRLPASAADGVYGSQTVEAVSVLQRQLGMKVNGIADRELQQTIDWMLDKQAYTDPSAFVVVDDDE